MSEQLQSGLHPDPELLNAFSEGVLPEQERRQCMAHLAECGRCRKIVFLAQAPAARPAVVLVKRPWYFRVPALGGAIAACVLVVVVSVYERQSGQSEVPAPRMARQTPAPPPARVAPLPAPIPEVKPRHLIRSAKVRPEFKLPPTQAKPVESARAEPPPPPAPAPISAAPAPKLQVDSVTAGAIAASGRNTAPLAMQPSGIKGYVADPTGAGISDATVTAKALTGSAHATAKTDSSGNFSMPGLPPGRYQVQIESRGFVRFSSQVEVRTSDQALLAATLNIGSSAQTVEVTSAAPTVDREAQTIRVETLSGQRPFASSVASGTRRLAVDAAGALYFSKNQGKHWKVIKPKWRGKVAEVAVLSADLTPLFQLTTDAGDVWSSPDGTHWQRQNK